MENYLFIIRIILMTEVLKMKRLIYVVLTFLFVWTCAFGCAPNMPEGNPKYQGLSIDQGETGDDSGGSTETETPAPDEATESNGGSDDEGTE